MKDISKIEIQEDFWFQVLYKLSAISLALFGECYKK